MYTLARSKNTSQQELTRIRHELTDLLDYNASKWKKLPIIRQVRHAITRRRPLTALEGELRGHMNGLLKNMVDIAAKAHEERQEITELEKQLYAAQEENWTPTQYLTLIREMTGFAFEAEYENQVYDMIGMFAKIDATVSPEKQEESRQRFYQWFKSHIELRRNFTDTALGACAVAKERVEEITRSYADLTQVRYFAEKTAVLLDHASKGTQEARATNSALQQWGTTLTKLARELAETKESVDNKLIEARQHYKSEIGKLQQSLYVQKALPQ